MTQGPSISSLEIAGYASVRQATVELTSGVTLLVGANGSGKSNVVGAFELLGRVLDGQVNDYLLTAGGVSSVLYAGPEGGDSAEVVRLKAWGVESAGLANGYQVVIQPAAEDVALVEETTYFHDRNRFPDPHDTRYRRSRESVLRERASTGGKERFVLEAMAGCRVFHFDDTSRDAPPKRRVDVGDDETLGSNAHNLAAVLLRLRHDDQPRYSRIVRVIRSVAPFFDDFVLEERRGSVLLRWRERHVDRVFSADALSDGTLRFVCLVTLLLQPDPPETIVLDEPELGLHPFAIHQLAAMLRVAARSSRVLAATQSVTLLSQFGLDEVAVVERTTRGTVVSRPDPAALAGWLDEYSLGEIWEKNLLGGRPGPDTAVSA